MGKYYDSYVKREDKCFYEGVMSRDFDEVSEIESSKIYKRYSYCMDLIVKVELHFIMEINIILQVIHIII